MFSSHAFGLLLSANFTVPDISLYALTICSVAGETTRFLHKYCQWLRVIYCTVLIYYNTLQKHAPVHWVQAVC